jgi:predicted ester cyclase
MDLLSPDIEFYDLGRPPVHGQADVRAALDRILVAFPDQRTTVRNLIESGDWLAVEVTFSGTNLGPAQGPAGNEIPATGKRVAIEVCHVIRFSERKLASYRVYGDMLAILGQLGLIPDAATA